MPSRKRKSTKKPREKSRTIRDESGRTWKDTGAIRRLLSHQEEYYRDNVIGKKPDIADEIERGRELAHRIVVKYAISVDLEAAVDSDACSPRFNDRDGDGLLMLPDDAPEIAHDALHLLRALDDMMLVRPDGTSDPEWLRYSAFHAGRFYERLAIWRPLEGDLFDRLKQIDDFQASATNKEYSDGIKCTALKLFNELIAKGVKYQSAEKTVKNKMGVSPRTLRNWRKLS